jgi:hypothetical protein
MTSGGACLRVEQGFHRGQFRRLTPGGYAAAEVAADEL